MLLKFLTFLRESPFIEGMGRILDFTGIINNGISPKRSDAEALEEDWGKVLGDYKHSFNLTKESVNGRNYKHRQ